GDRVLAGAPAPEILASDQNVPRSHLLGETRPRVAERVQVELVLPDHERRVAAGHDLVGVEVVAEDPCPTQSSISMATPLRAAAMRRPRRIAATWRMSTSRPLVHEPRKTTSIG